MATLMILMIITMATLMILMIFPIQTASLPGKITIRYISPLQGMELLGSMHDSIPGNSSNNLQWKCFMIHHCGHIKIFFLWALSNNGTIFLFKRQLREEKNPIVFDINHRCHIGQVQSWGSKYLQQKIYLKKKQCIGLGLVQNRHHLVKN